MRQQLFPAALALLALLAGRAPAADTDPKPNPDPRPRHVEETYPSGDRKVKVRVERFEPAGKKGPFPIIVLLPGIDGLVKAPAVFREAAESLVKEGFVVLLPHYHDRTGTNPAQVAELTKQFQGCLKHPWARNKEWRENRRLFAEWEGAVGDAVAHARKLAIADGDRVVLVGYSMGGFLAAAVASRHEQEIAALVVLSGGVTRETADRVRAGGLPPTFVIHGKLDPVVPVAEARRLVRLLEDREVPWDDFIHPTLGHGLATTGLVPVPDLKALEAAQRQALAFLKQRIGHEDPKVGGK